MDAWCTVKKFCHDNSLSLVLLVLFLVTFAGQIFAGLHEHNEDLHEHGELALSLGAYLKSGHFLEATGATWSSEFLQIVIFVVLSAWLVQKGSPEGLSDDDDDDDDACDDPRAPWPVRAGGVWKWLYSHSLSLVFTLLFLVSLVMHARGGAQEYSLLEAQHGKPGVTTLQYLMSARFWFQSFQNWQSGFLSLAAMVYFLIYLREKGSVVSKRLTAPNDEDE
jgi:uncharacterized membrane protein YhaH (DUF805 family)